MDFFLGFIIGFIWGVSVVKVFEMIFLILSVLVPSFGVYIALRIRKENVKNKIRELRYELYNGLKRFNDDENNFRGMTINKLEDLIGNLENYVRVRKKILGKKETKKNFEIMKVAKELFKNSKLRYEGMDRNSKIKILEKIKKGYEKFVILGRELGDTYDK